MTTGRGLGGSGNTATAAGNWPLLVSVGPASKVGPWNSIDPTTGNVRGTMGVPASCVPGVPRLGLGVPWTPALTAVAGGVVAGWGVAGAGAGFAGWFLLSRNKNHAAAASFRNVSIIV